MRSCLVKNVIVWLGRFKGEIIIPLARKTYRVRSVFQTNIWTVLKLCINSQSCRFLLFYFFFFLTSVFGFRFFKVTES